MTTHLEEANYVDARTPEEVANEPKSTITYSSSVEEISHKQQELLQAKEMIK
jgi:hypothetical protein